MFHRPPQPIAEHEATGATARVYHEIRQTLRVTGVNLNFRTWAGFGPFLPIMWTAMQPIAASHTFEMASDSVRARAAELALTLPRLDVTAALGESQRYQAEQALALYHYINPKLLVFTLLVARGLSASRAASRLPAMLPAGARVPMGPPARMAAMEMIDEDPSDARLRRLFRDINKTMRLRSINSDYRTLALWPEYLQPAWARLKPIVRSDAYTRATAALSDAASTAAESLPTPAGLAVARLEKQGVKAQSVVDTTRRFEQLLSPLILNIALLAGDWWPAERLGRSPFPVSESSASPKGGRS